MFGALILVAISAWCFGAAFKVHHDAQRRHAEELRGREVELHRIKAWLKSRRPRSSQSRRLGWIQGRPGVGKSMLMMRLVADYSHSPSYQKGIFFHRFRSGDSRNSRESFLRLLQEALLAWEPLKGATGPLPPGPLTVQELEEDLRTRLEAVASLQSKHAKAPAPAFWVFVDGLDELAELDPGFPELLPRFALPGTVWLLAGRPEHDLDEALGKVGCEALFEGGLPGMSPANLRAMLESGLGNGRYALLRRDEDLESGVRNPFVERVVEQARGLPLYVHLLLEDLRSGRLGIHDERKLPPGLKAYFDTLIARMGISAVRADLTLIVCLLAQAAEPLDATGLAALLAREPRRTARYLTRVEAALRVGQALLRQAPTPESDQGWALYHQSFRDFASGGVPGEPPSALDPMAHEARDLLADLASRWEELEGDAMHPLRNHLFRWGTRYALGWQADEGALAASQRLTNFSYLHARIASSADAEIASLIGDYDCPAVHGPHRHSDGFPTLDRVRQRPRPPLATGRPASTSRTNPPAAGHRRGQRQPAGGRGRDLARSGRSTRDVAPTNWDLRPEPASPRGAGPGGSRGPGPGAGHLSCHGPPVVWWGRSHRPGLGSRIRTMPTGPSGPSPQDQGPGGLLRWAQAPVGEHRQDHPPVGHAEWGLPALPPRPHKRRDLGGPPSQRAGVLLRERGQHYPFATCGSWRVELDSTATRE